MTSETANKGNILLVDDDKFLVEMYGTKFSSSGYQVQACVSVDEALALIRGGFMPDGVIFDIVMPGNDGFSLLQKLSEEKLAPSAVRIALTNQSNDDEKKKAEELGVDRYIVKASMIPSEVVHVVEEEITKRKGAK